MCGLGEYHNIPLQAPAEQHLGRGLAVRLGDLRDDGVLQRAGVLAFAVEGDAADR
jgi:hypothetical protein